MELSLNRNQLTEAALKALHLIDLTSLNDDDTEERIAALAASADTPVGTPAALCVYPRFVGAAHAALARHGLVLPVATVTNFPHGAADPDAGAAAAAGIGSPTASVRRLITPRFTGRGQRASSCRENTLPHSPRNAIGTTGAPAPIAKRAPPVLYLPWLPTGVRVPSGNMMTHAPSAIRLRPWRITESNAFLPSLRLMWTMCSIPSAQPKNGTYSSSRLNT